MAGVRSFEFLYAGYRGLVLPAAQVKRAWSEADAARIIAEFAREANPHDIERLASHFTHFPPRDLAHALEVLAHQLAGFGLVVIERERLYALLDDAEEIPISDLVDPTDDTRVLPPERVVHDHWIAFELVDTLGRPVAATYVATIDGSRDSGPMPTPGKHRVDNLAEGTRAAVRFVAVGSFEDEERTLGPVYPPDSTPNLGPVYPPDQQPDGGGAREDTVPFISFEVVHPDGAPATGTFRVTLGDGEDTNGQLGAPVEIDGVSREARPVVALAVERRS